MPYIDIHTHNSNPQKDVLKVVNIFPVDDVDLILQEGMLYSAGIHPWYIDEVDVEESLKKIREWLEAGKIAAIGETGIDALRGPEMQIQEKVFLRQVDVSEEFEVPLIIHCVKAYNEILVLRKQTKAKQPWILHGFNSSVQMMRQMTEAGIYISLGPALLKSKKLQDVCREVPDGMLFFETDVSDVQIKDIYTKAAEIRGIKIEELERNIFNNFKRVF